MKILTIILVAQILVLGSCQNTKESTNGEVNKKPLSEIKETKQSEWSLDKLLTDSRYNKWKIVGEFEIGTQKHVLFSAMNCVNCDSGPSIYLVESGETDIENLVVIGISAKIYDYSTDSLVSSYSVGFGDCLGDGANRIVTYVKYLAETGEWQNNGSMFDFSDEGISKRKIEESELKEVIEKVKNNCTILEQEEEYTTP